MSKCKLPPREVDAVIDDLPGKKLFDACDGTYLGSVVADPTPQTEIPADPPTLWLSPIFLLSLLLGAVITGHIAQRLWRKSRSTRSA